ncbi:MAG: prephenate dehydratase [Lachnospiraceae bacterium]|nr:prephenate dehydratase [Lachnospiraceae bacterium]
MKDLKEIRERIDTIDHELVSLFQERMDCAREVAEYKKGKGMGVYDRKREEEKLVSLSEQVEGFFLKRSIKELFRQIMSISRKYQYQLLGTRDRYIENYFHQVDELTIFDDTRVVYQGVEGAYSQLAAEKFFGEAVDNYHVDTFDDVAKALNNGDADYGVLPIENSSAGNVEGNYDILLKNDVCIVGEVIISIEHALIGLPGSTKEDIKIVYSHPQGLMQCREYLNEMNVKKISVNNTAGAAKKVLKEQDASHGAVASERAAALYGLSILERKINDRPNNSTRFFILSKKRQYKKNADKVSISFSLPHESGTLYNILSHLIFNDLSMTNIESAPLRDREWEYRFFIDVEGNLRDPAMKNALKGIREETADFKILGNY